ncbi:(d)CMP kinase [Acinetobacter baumannii]
MEDLSRDLKERDERDMNRSSAPLKAAEGAYHLDTSDMTADEAVQQVLSWYAALGH